MSRLPDTTRQRPRRKLSLSRFAPIVFVAVLAMVVALPVALVRDRGNIPSPGEQVYAAGVEDIAAARGEAAFPGSDDARFGPGTETVRVYLRLEDLPSAEGMEARIERSGRSSLLVRLLGAQDLRADGGSEDRLSRSEAGVSGVVSFVVRAVSGPLPAGEYVVEVRSAPAGVSGRVLARKYFVVGDRGDRQA